MTASEIATQLRAKRAGPGKWMAKCPAHDDREASLSIAEGKTGVLLKCFAGCEFDAIVAALGIEPSAMFHVRPSKVKTILATYDYCDESGKLLYQAVRFEPKSFLQRQPDGHGGWIWNMKGARRVPFHLPEVIAANTVCIAEGEKDCLALDKAVKSFPPGRSRATTTNIGGAGKWHDGYSPFLQHKTVFVFADNDDPGRNHAQQVCASVAPFATTVRLVELSGLPEKGDVSDWLETHTPEELREILGTTPEWNAAAPDIAENTFQSGVPPQEGTASIAPLAPFDCLGHENGTYYFLPGASNQILAMSASSLTKPSGLLQLAPLSHWETLYPGKTGPNWIRAANDAIQNSLELGAFHADQERGIGAWRDQGRIVIHLGDRLLVDGQPTPLRGCQSHYIYPAAAPLLENLDAPPLTDAQADDFCDLVAAFPWNDPLSAQFLVGWLFLAQFSGALSWRPHLHLIAPAGTGKSWTIANLIAPIVGEFALMLQFRSTEAGIRQALKRDGRPVIFDEAESKNMQDQARLQSVLELARQASSESGASIVKGGADGHAVHYRTRSVFCFASIHDLIVEEADLSRITQLEMCRSENSTRNFPQLQRQTQRLLTRDFCAGFRVRAARALPLMLENSGIVAASIAALYGDRRLGDQLGTLLGTCYTFRTVKQIVPSEADLLARLIVDRKRLENGQRVGEWGRLLTHLYGQKISQIEVLRGTVQRTVGELIELADGAINGDPVDALEANRSLQRVGLMVRDHRLWIASAHAGLQGLLRGTAWEQNWKQILSYAPDAKKEEPQRYAGTLTRSISLPL